MIVLARVIHTAKSTWKEISLISHPLYHHCICDIIIQATEQNGIVYFPFLDETLPMGSLQFRQTPLSYSPCNCLHNANHRLHGVSASILTSPPDIRVFDAVCCSFMLPEAAIAWQCNKKASCIYASGSKEERDTTHESSIATSHASDQIVCVKVINSCV